MIRQLTVKTKNLIIQKMKGKKKALIKRLAKVKKRWKRLLGQNKEFLGQHCKSSSFY